MKAKKCKNCLVFFTPERPLQSVCSVKCSYEWQSKLKQAKLLRDAKKEKKEAKEKLLTHSQYLKIAQVVFNTYCRYRDKSKEYDCICCNKPLTGKIDAGHFFSVGAYPNLRFNEDNCHAQRVDCNQHKHGNLIEYALNLPKRIGNERFENLYKIKSDPLKLSIPEIKELIKHYKTKIKELK